MNKNLKNITNNGEQESGFSKLEKYKEEGYLFHGSPKSNLKKIEPNESGHGNNYVYAVSEPVFAAMFSLKNRGNTLVAMWRRNSEGVPCLYERKEGIFDTLFEGQESSIYVVEKKNFFQEKGMWASEYVSKKEEVVVDEVHIEDVREFLLELEKYKEFQLIKYEDREKYFPNIEEDEIKDTHALIKKYGGQKTLELLEKWRPDLIDKVSWFETNREATSELNKRNSI